MTSQTDNSRLVARRRFNVVVHRLALFHRPDFSPASVTCDREQDRYYVSADSVQVQFTFYNCMRCLISALYGPPAKGSIASGYFIKACRHAIMMPYF